jgi:hypothetical protein
MSRAWRNLGNSTPSARPVRSGLSPSDECLAFRTVDDVHVLSPIDPGSSATQALVRHGAKAVPGMVDYIIDCFPGPDAVPRGCSIRLIAILASRGDNPLLQKFDKFPYYQTQQMRQCILSGRRVVLTGLYPRWGCEP